MRFGLFIHFHHIDALLPEVGIATLELLDENGPTVLMCAFSFRD